MNSIQLAEEISKVTHIKRADVIRMVAALSIVVTNSIDEEIEIPDVGVFRIKNRKARVGRDPRSMEEVHIPARKVPEFRFLSNFKERVRYKKK